MHILTKVLLTIVVLGLSRAGWLWIHDHEGDILVKRYYNDSYDSENYTSNGREMTVTTSAIAIVDVIFEMWTLSKKPPPPMKKCALLCHLTVGATYVLTCLFFFGILDTQWIHAQGSGSVQPKSSKEYPTDFNFSICHTKHTMEFEGDRGIGLSPAIMDRYWLV